MTTDRKFGHWRLLVVAAGIWLAATTGCSSKEPPVAEGLVEFPPSAIGEFLQLADDDQAANAQRVEQQAAYSRALQECMVLNGYDDFSAPTLRGGQDSSGLEQRLAGLSEYEFATDYGFGISTIGSETITVEVSGSSSGINEYVQDMTDLERRTFAKVYGNAPPDDSDPDGPSCLDLANQAVSETDSMRRVSLFSEALEDIDSIYEADPRVAPARRAYASCMVADGFSFTTPDEARGAFEDRFFDWLTSMPASSAGNFLDSLSAEAEGALQQLQEDEIEVALFSLACEAPQRPTLTTVRTEIESAWLTEHRDRLLYALEDPE